MKVERGIIEPVTNRDQFKAIKELITPTQEEKPKKIGFLKEED